MSFKQNVIAMALIVSAIAFTSQTANATSATGTVAVTATTSASVSLTFVTDGAGITMGNSGTSAATVACGSVQAYGGSVPGGVSKTVNGSTDWALSTPIDVVVQVANQTSSNYTLAAGLQSADGTNTWHLGATAL